MNEMPPDADEPEDIDERYRRAAAQDPGRPREHVRRAILAHAARLAAERAPRQVAAAAVPPAAVEAERSVPRRRTSAGRRAPRQVWRGPVTFGAFAAAALAALLIAPRFLLTPQGAAVSVGRDSALPPVGSVGVPLAPAAAAPPPLAAEKAAGAAEAGDRAGVTARARAPARPGAADKSLSGPAMAAAPPPAARESQAADEAGATQAEPASRDAVAGHTTNSAVAQLSGARRAPAAVAADPAQALRRAAGDGDLDLLETLLERPAAIDARDTQGRTALMLAILRGQADAVALLLAHGADANAADAQGVTPLQVALAGTQPGIVNTLRAHGAR